MRIGLVKERIKLMSQRRRAWMMSGPPGCGKTEIARQVAEDLDMRFIVWHPVTASPVDYKGMPYVGGGKAEWLPYGDLREVIESSDPTLVFVDDAGQAIMGVLASIAQIFWERKINGHMVSDHVSFGMATNRREDKSGVSGIIEMLKNRCRIYEVESNLDDWADWAMSAEIAPEVISHARWYSNREGGMFNPSKITSDNVARCTPRSVEMMSEDFQDGVEDAESLGANVGLGYATDFCGHVKLTREYPCPADIIANPLGPMIPKADKDGNMPLAALYAVTTALTMETTKENSGRILQYIERLPKDFQALGIRDMARAYSGMRTTPAYIKWHTKNQDILIAK